MIDKKNENIQNNALPGAAILEMSFKCNHSCVYCSCPWYAPGSAYPAGAALDLDGYKKLIDHIIDERGVYAITFSGGEPLLHPDMKDIVRYAAAKQAEYAVYKDGVYETQKRQVALYMISNGALMDEDWLDFLIENNCGLGLSLPGLQKYKLHTGSKISTPEHILKLLKAGADRKYYITANITATKANFSEMYETMAEALLNGAGSLLINRFLPGGRGLSYIKELFLDHAMTRELLCMADDVLKTANRSGHTGTEIPACLLRGLKLEKLGVSSGCSAARGFFAIDPSGYIRVCNHSPVRLGRFDEIALTTGSKYWRAFKNKTYLPRECDGCIPPVECDCPCREAGHITGGDIPALDPVFSFCKILPDKF